MTEIIESIELTRTEYEKMQELMKELNLSIHQFVEIAVKDAIVSECGKNTY